MPIEIITLAGTPHEIGGHHGELLAAGAAAMCETRIDLCLRAAPTLSRDDLLALAGESLPVFADFAPDTYAEFCGIAEGAGLAREALLIGNGYTDFVDLVRRHAGGPSECTSFAVGPIAAGPERCYVGQTWDMNAGAFPHVVAFRRLPTTGPASLTMTTAGCLSLVGMNECGIAIGNTNLVPHDARAGVMYLGLIHTVLAQTSFEPAVNTITRAPRMSGHYYYVAGPRGEFAGIETTALRHTILHPDARGLFAHANHYTDPALSAYVGETTPSANSVAREARMWELIPTVPHTGGLAALTQLLTDHEVPLCRHAEGIAEVRTCSAALMSPADGVIRMTKGNPCEGGFIDVRVDAAGA